MKPGDFDACLASPPYADGCVHTGGNDPHPEHVEGGTYRGVGLDGCISSPPYAESLASDDPDKRGGLFHDPKRHNDKTLTATYGPTDGQLGAMAAGGFEAAVSSPPYEASFSGWAGGGTKDFNGIPPRVYSQTASNLGNAHDATFWEAARTIVEQVYLVLKPRAHAVWVLKAYVRSGQIVDFPDQWRRMCEACGFETLHVHRAWLVEEHGAQATLEGTVERRHKERKSFFAG